MIKVYMLFIKETKELYAFTEDRRLYKTFKKQRNMSVFIKKKTVMENEEYKKFANKHKDNVLIDSCLYDGNDDIEIVTTVEEESMMDIISDIIYRRLIKIRLELADVLDDEHLKVIVDSTSIVTEANLMHINTFELFYYLFRYTFENVSKVEVVKIASDKFIKEL